MEKREAVEVISEWYMKCKHLENSWGISEKIKRRVAAMRVIVEEGCDE